MATLELELVQEEVIKLTRTENSANHQILEKLTQLRIFLEKRGVILTRSEENYLGIPKKIKISGPTENMDCDELIKAYDDFIKLNSKTDFAYH